jgi:hypothetical protein
MTMSFSTEETENICLDWASGVSSSVFCNQTPEVCALQEIFPLIGGLSVGADTVVK